MKKILSVCVSVLVLAGIVFYYTQKNKNIIDIENSIQNSKQLKNSSTNKLLEEEEEGYTEALNGMISAITNNNLTEVKKISKTLNINETVYDNSIFDDTDAFSFIYLASAKGYLNIVKFLFESGAKINGCCNPPTPLGIAAENGHLEVVKYLVENGAEVTLSRRMNSDHPVIMAAYGNNTNIVKYLLDNGANPHEEQGDGSADYGELINIAIDNDNFEMLQVIIEHDADSHWNYRSLLDYASKTNNKQIVKYLKSKI